MIILGVNYIAHDASASIIKHGEFVVACEEERFTRNKRTGRFPVNAIEHCLRVARINKDEIDVVAFGLQPFRYLKLLALNGVYGFPKSLKTTPYVIKLIVDTLNIKKNLREIGINKSRVEYCNHHLCHAYCAYYSSGLDSSFVLTADGRGECESICLFKADRSSLKKYMSINYPHSLGYIYSAMAYHLGFKPQMDEGKVMALASYGKDKCIFKENSIVNIVKNKIRVNLKYFDYYYNWKKKRQWVSKEFEETFGPRRQAENTIEQRHMDESRMFQKIIENRLIELINRNIANQGNNNLCIAGGLALNCELIRNISRNTGFKKIYVPPVPGDCGTSLGAAIIVCTKHKDESALSLNEKLPYVGPDCKLNKQQIARIRSNKCKIYKPVNLSLQIAKEMANQKIVGWFQGKMEFGQRALGNRSIVGDPRDLSIKNKISITIKGREWFRPLAPAVLEEEAHKYFILDEKLDDTYRFMAATAIIRDEVRGDIPGVSHIDGTARIQLVRKKDNKTFWELINYFYKITGIPMIINTSFNTLGLPIVFSTENALNIYGSSDIDILVLDDYVIYKRHRQL